MSDYGENSEKRPKPRSANFSPLEEAVLCTIIYKYRSVVDSRRSDAAMWKEKEDAWNNIATEYNNRGPAESFPAIDSQDDPVRLVPPGTRGDTIKINDILDAKLELLSLQKALLEKQLQMKEEEMQFKQKQGERQLKKLQLEVEILEIELARKKGVRI